MSLKEGIKKSILRSLITPPRWGGKHTELKNITRGLTTSVLTTKKGKKALEKAIKELINDGWLLSKKSAGEIHVSLNPRKRKEILEFVIK